MQILLQECILHYSSCHYELGIYNITNGDESIPDILAKIIKISETLKCSCDIIKAKQGIFGIFFEFLLQSQDTDNKIRNKSNRKKFFQEIKISTLLQLEY